MKLIHLVSGGDAGGAKTHVLSLLSELQKTEEAALLCLGEGPLSRAAAEMGLAPVVLRGTFARQIAALARITERERPAILHSHGARANTAAILVRARPELCRVSTIHSDPSLDYLGRPIADGTLGFLNRRALGRMDALVCVSDAMAGRFRRFGPQVWPIYNGLDFSAPIPEKRHQSGLIIVGTAARFDPVKDLPTLLRGFAMAAKRDSRLRLRLAGAGREEKRLRALAAALELSGRVEFCGWLEDMEAFYSTLDVVVLTSVSETFPYTLLTAARHALPVIATDVGGVNALVRGGEGGFLIRPGDAEALAAALRTLASDNTKRRTMGQALCRRGGMHFTLRQMADTQREIYRRVLEKDTDRGQ